jgi:hypothetical protein
MPKNSFSCFFVLMFCRLLWNDLGELVLMMERDPGCSMDILYELCESWFWWKIGVKLSREQWVVEDRRIYMKLVELKKQTFGKGMKLSS